MKQWVSYASTILLLGLFSTTVVASFKYFDEQSEYFEKKARQKKLDDNIEKEHEKLTEKMTKKLDEKFDWKRQLDPNDESLDFFREGDHLPPRPYIEMVRDPSDDNIKKWFLLMKKKNELSRRLAKKMQSYIDRHEVPQPIRGDYQQKVNNLKPAKLAIHPKGFRLRLYYHSACPHCKRMIRTMTGLARRGFYVEIKQIDDNLAARKDIPFPVTRATKKELEEKQINSWPVLLIGNINNKKVYRINGYQDEATIIQSLGGI